MTFIWILGSGSKWNNNEIRYSMRSVFKFHPDARMVIVGEKPEWYTGEHYYIPDSDKCPYVNVWRKLEFACTLADEFIYMDDDFYLLEPLEVVHYYKGTMLDFYLVYKNKVGKWPDVVKASYNALPDALRHCLHVPLPINSTNFMRIASDYPERFEAPSLVPRQIYCANETAYPLKFIKHDVKFAPGTKEDKLNGLKFWSTTDYIHRLEWPFEKLYPNPSPNEIPKRLGSNKKQTRNKEST